MLIITEYDISGDLIFRQIMKGIKLHLLIGILKMFRYENASWPCPNGTLSVGHYHVASVCFLKCLFIHLLFVLVF